MERANEPLFVEIEGDRAANFYSMARRMVGALEAERRTAQERARVLDEILG